MNVVKLWFGLEAPVGRGAYLATGVGMMVFKYALEAALFYAGSGQVLSPLVFFAPLLSVREEALRAGSDWMPIALAGITLPFLWIGLSMSVRRAVDAGQSAWFGLLFAVPLLNYVVMLLLAVLPSRAGAAWHPPMRGPYRTGVDATGPTSVRLDSGLKSVLYGFLSAIGVGASMVWFSIYGLGDYSAALFFGTPLAMGAVSAFFYNRPHPRKLLPTIATSIGATVLLGSSLLLFALEGLVCIIMATPIAAVMAVAGSVLGWVIAAQAKPSRTATAAFIMALPASAALESVVVEPPQYEVMTAVEIDAPPEAVWPNVVGFSELPPPSGLVFAAGVAYPMRARIEGEGVGAVRYCEFSTGPFVEPITAWEPPHRLGFDVVAQPPAMKEWSPFEYVHPPHLDASIRSRRGEFRLVPLPGGRTRLEGRTFYELSIYPDIYWKVWSDELLHAIHRRVLDHVKSLSEGRGGR